MAAVIRNATHQHANQGLDVSLVTQWCVDNVSFEH